MLRRESCENDLPLVVESIELMPLRSLHVIDTDLIAEGDRVVTLRGFEGTQHGPFMGVAPTGKRIVLDGMTVFRVVNGRITERWGALAGTMTAVAASYAGLQAPLADDGHGTSGSLLQLMLLTLTPIVLLLAGGPPRTMDRARHVE